MIAHQAAASFRSLERISHTFSGVVNLTQQSTHGVAWPSSTPLQGHSHSRSAGDKLMQQQATVSMGTTSKEPWIQPEKSRQKKISCMQINLARQQVVAIVSRLARRSLQRPWRRVASWIGLISRHNWKTFLHWPVSFFFLHDPRPDCVEKKGSRGGFLLRVEQSFPPASFR